MFSRPIKVLIFIFVAQLLGNANEASYFPPDTFVTSGADWYSPYLRAVDEPSLYELSKNDRTAHVYRVTYLPPYSPYLAVRLTVQRDGSGLLELRKQEQVNDKSGGIVAGERRVRTAKLIISASAVRRFEQALERINFWQIKPERRLANAVLGGDRFLYEEAIHGHYHGIEVSDPEEPQLLDPGLLLMRYAGEHRAE